MNILNPKATYLVNTYCFILHVLPFEVKVTQSCPTLAIPWTTAPRLLCPWDSPGKNAGVGCHFLLQGDIPNPGIEPESPAMQADSLPTEL